MTEKNGDFMTVHLVAGSFDKLIFVYNKADHFIINIWYT
jgi:hypothetical protein